MEVYLAVLAGVKSLFLGPVADARSVDTSWVALDKNEGVVKRHFFAAMLSSTARISESWRTEALKLSR
jgi:hypothetical protein